MDRIGRTAGDVLLRMSKLADPSSRDRAVIACLERAGYVATEGPAGPEWWEANLAPLVEGEVE